MTDDLKIKRWHLSDKIILWAVAILCVANFIIGVLTLGPDLLNW